MLVVVNYNVAGIKVPFWGFKKDFRYEGWHVRAGITYGYHWVSQSSLES